jgi:adenosylhomocysteine nucleosidase
VDAARIEAGRVHFPGGLLSEAVVVIAAHAFEARAAAGVAHGVSKEPWGQWMLYRGDIWDLPLAVIRCGPGKVAAAAAAQAAVQYLAPSVLVSFGTAGSPDPNMETGTLTIARTVVDVALTELGELPVKIPDRFEPDPALNRRLLDVPGTWPASLLCWEGHVVSPLNQPPLAREIVDRVVVDWESAAVAQVSQMWDLPWAAVKVVSDHGEPDRLRYLAMVAKRPLQWGAEVIRRACDAFVRDRVTTQDVEQPEEGSA